MAVELIDNLTEVGTITTLSAPLASTDIVLQTRGPASLVLQQEGQSRWIIIDPVSGNEELVLLTGGAWSAQWQVVRGIESTDALDFPVGSVVRHVITAGAIANLFAQGGVINPPPAGGGSIEQLTVDTAQLYKPIYFSNGTVRAIPASAEPPTAPTSLAATTVQLSYVTLSWTAPSSGNAANYTILRNGSNYITGITSTTYTDYGVAVGQTYNYKVQAFDVYGEPSPYSNQVSAFINPSLDHPPIISIKTFPDPIIPGYPAIVRVNAYSLDAIELSYILNVDSGLLQSTPDLSVWLLTA